ncbi:MAG TPA: hypothetical protein VNS55_03025 [Nocardioides sp.]|nr:hypothetical protein [Nocardioides sp.]
MAAVLVIVGVIAVTHGGDDAPQPAGPSTTISTSAPATDGSGLTSPLVAPESLLDVRELGFRVEPVTDFDRLGWSIDRDGQEVTLSWEGVPAARVRVVVRYQGAPEVDDEFSYDGAAIDWSRGEEVAIHGATGTYYSDPAFESSGEFAAYLKWQYAPDSWAYVSATSWRDDPGPERLRSALQAIAEAVAPGGEAVRLPVRSGTFPPSLPRPATLSGVSWMREGLATAALEFAGVRIEISAAEGEVWGGGAAGGEGRFRVTENQVWLDVDGTTRLISSDDATMFAAYPLTDLKEVLADFTVAPLDDPSRWFDLETALSPDREGLR